MPAGMWVFFIVFFVFWFYHGYLLLFRPTTWVEWFIRKTWRPFGLAVTIEDQEKLKRRTRLLGLIYVIGGIIFFALVAGVLPGK